MGDQTELRVRGRAMMVAVAVAVVLLVGALWAAGVDLASDYVRNSVPLDVLSTLYKILSAAGLLLVGRLLGSQSMRLLALLLVLMTLGSMLVDAEWFVSRIQRLADRLAEVLPLSSGFVELAGLFLGLALVAGVLVWIAFIAAGMRERSAVVTLITLLFVLGVFVGPVNAIASRGINREWLFAEDLGQVVTLAIIAAYVAGLVAEVARRRISVHQVRHQADLDRINEALDAALVALEEFTSGRIAAVEKEGGDPVTEADLKVDAEMRRILPQSGEGWLSEESVDDKERLGKRRVWIVDPIDGTREFVEGIPEWCVSIGLIEDGRPVAGGIHNPATGERITGSIDTGVVYEGPNPLSGKTTLDGARVGASRSEIRRGEWQQFAGEQFEIVPMGSVAYKLALVAAGRLDAAWTFVPKHEWDLAAGVALVESAGGWAALKDGSTPTWNDEDPLVPGFIATSAALRRYVAELLLG